MIFVLALACQSLPVAPDCVSVALEPAALEPLDALPGRSPAAVAVLNDLRTLERGRVLVGQNIGHIDYRLDESYAAYFAALSPAPAIMAVDYGYEPPSAARLDEANALLIAHAAAGGLVSVSTHTGNPITGDDIGDRRYSPDAFADLFVEGTDAHARQMDTLARLADGLEALRDAGVVVLWRPYHEPNGSWFWYSTNRGGGWTERADFAALWRQMFDYFADERGLDNLLWVYAANAKLSENIHDTDWFYPGDDVVDVVALDLYDTGLPIDQCGSYARLAGLGKPIGLAEVGPGKGDNNPGSTWDLTEILDAADRHEGLAFATLWHGSLGRSSDEPFALVEFDAAAAFLADPRAVTRDELP